MDPAGRHVRVRQFPHRRVQHGRQQQVGRLRLHRNRTHGARHR
ncbi:hypothetical protein ACFFX0_16790 [Citricoccus parietis]|uniref:Uncharacterized protein n=1 Tax=Citricoccus parietis TaxID=592307 RepID=A0ABV5G1F3_9MICC